MDFGNLSKMVNNVVDGTTHNLDKNNVIDSITNHLNDIRIDAFDYDDLEARIEAKKNKILSTITVLLLRRKLNKVVDDGIKKMKLVNQCANSNKTKNVFDDCDSLNPTVRKLHFYKESTKYVDAVREDVLENSFVKSNPNITSPVNDRIYILRRIVERQIQEKEIDISPGKVSEAQAKTEKNQEENIGKQKYPRTIDELIDAARKQKELDDLSCPGGGGKPTPGNNAPGGFGPGR